LHAQSGEDNPVDKKDRPSQSNKSIVDKTTDKQGNPSNEAGSISCGGHHISDPLFLLGVDDGTIVDLIHGYEG